MASMWWYRAYLNCVYWRYLRAGVHAVRGNRCEQCGSVVKLHVHHLTYERPGEERMEDLQLLCSLCHGPLSKDGITAFTAVLHRDDPPEAVIRRLRPYDKSFLVDKWTPRRR